MVNDYKTDIVQQMQLGKSIDSVTVSGRRFRSLSSPIQEVGGGVVPRSVHRVILCNEPNARLSKFRHIYIPE